MVRSQALLLKALAMPFYWLIYRHNNQISVVIEPGAIILAYELALPT